METVLYKPPALPAHTFASNILDLRNDAISFMRRLSQLGDLAHFRLATHRAYLVVAPQLVSEVLIQQAQVCVRNRLAKRAAGKIVGEAVALLDGEDHRRMRALMMPAFSRIQLNRYENMMTAQAIQLIKEWDGRKELDFGHEMQEVTMRVAGAALFGKENLGCIDSVIKAMNDFQEILAIETRQAIPLPDWLPIPRKRRLRETSLELNRVVREIIRERRDSGRIAVNQADDLLTKLIFSAGANGEPGLTEQEVQDQAVFLLIAGHETTAGALTWVPYLLSHHPEVAEAVYAEIDAVVGRGPLEPARLGELILLEQVIKETLRLYPSAWLYARTAATDLALGRWKIPSGSSLFLCPYVTHRLPDLFPEPDRFLPQRFAPANERRLPRCAYYPFGAGGTSCIGQQFSVTEAKIILATAFSRYRIEMLDDKEVVPQGLALLRPAQPIIVRLVPRR